MLFWYATSVLAGLGFVFQKAVNSQLRIEIGSAWWAGFISYFSGRIAEIECGQFVCRTRRRKLSCVPYLINAPREFRKDLVELIARIERSHLVANVEGRRPFAPLKDQCFLAQRVRHASHESDPHVVYRGILHVAGKQRENDAAANRDRSHGVSCRRPSLF